jgi:serine/threonine-protein kinase
VASVDAIFMDNERSIYMQMPYYAGGTLRDWARRLDAKTADERALRIKPIARQLLLGLEYIHSQHVIHCDIKPDNIWLKSDSQDSDIVIGDFDVSQDTTTRAAYFTQLATKATASGMVGFTVDYMAPELFENKAATTASDVYAAGLVLFELYFPEVKRPPNNSGSRLAIPKHSDEQVCQLLSPLTEPDPSKRATASHALAMPYFAQVDIELGQFSLCQLVCECLSK